MKTRDMVMGVVSVLTAAGCVRLGFWQLHRLEERRAKNALVSTQTAESATNIADVRMQDTSKLHWRRLKFRGVPDYQRENVLSSRSQNGSVGVQVVTAVRPIDNSWPDTSVLVIRGWMVAPDGRAYTRATTQEGETLDVDGLITEFPPAGKGAVRMPSAPIAFRWLDRDTLSKEAGVPLAPFVLLQLGDTVQRDVTKIVRIPPPSLSEGPHKSYAVQWFTFALVALGGYGAYLVSQREKERGT
ncbi:MAG: SURF1 family protein [Gemmatimonadaceae bacterium]